MTILDDNIFCEIQMFVKLHLTEAVVQRCSVKNMLLEISQNSQENTCAREPESCNFIKKETLALAFSCEFCKISKNTFS